ncbi:alpha/beta-hydrolase [Gloeophyllum trabeum ATCC 11539]|uniref:Alpha/beta-hydrolase n=1 Tax=Gloeophyllum trabeum (strain ATCC 11539 / FP-39264 / Madison 617) TaxID=670483 RepID=S7Q577_GLOTA|nr:alpha/beta-hydrolase [Gloeophyllum trabeum ATCC 11539]EPQ54662.1 alpha/beta-hydrolase [Gloeophyllum trabeum ATCC 11539]
MPPHPNTGFLVRAQRVFLYLGIAYAALVVLLAIPFFQLHAVYLHSVRWPLFAKFDVPEKYGLAPGKTLNVKLTTSDNQTIGAWFVLSDSYYHTLQPPIDPVTLTTEHVRASLQTYPTILFLHGNAATRAVPFRVQHYSAFTSRLRANVLAIDYRGFADSSGTPSEAGLVRDTRAAYDWVRERGARAEDVLVVGHSLGTGVAARFVRELEEAGGRVKGMVLLAPFLSIGKLVDTYHVLGFIPLMKPLRNIPYAANLVLNFLTHHFDTSSVIADIKSPILLAHAEDDWDIPCAHSDQLFSSILEPLLPRLPDLPKSAPEISQLTKDDWSDYLSAQSMRKGLRGQMVTETGVPNLGTIQELRRGNGDGKVVYVKPNWGGHDRVGLMEGVQDIIGRTFGML